MATIDQVVDSYARFLQNRCGNPSPELKAFVDRLNDDPEAARAEAVIFGWAQNVGLNPELHEKAGTGGMDFKCKPSTGTSFLLEVTSFGSEALAEASSLSTDMGDLVGGFFCPVTPDLKSRVGKKLEQLARGGQLPRALAIVSEHPKAHLVFGRLGATSLLVSDPKIAVPLSSHGPRPYNTTDLKHSVFFRRSKADPQGLIPCRRSASAVLLVAVGRISLEAVGVLHPEPAVPFDINSLPQVPLLRVREWPPSGGTLKLEWTLPTDPPFPEHKRIR